MNTKRCSFPLFLLWSICFFVLPLSFSYGQLHRKSIDSVLNNIRTSTHPLELADGIDFINQNRVAIESSFSEAYLIYVYEVMAHGYHTLGRLDESEAFAVQCLSQINHHPKTEHASTRVRVLCLLGILQKERGLYELGNLQYEEALALSTTPSDSLYILNNQANLFKEQQLFSKAIDAYRLGLTLVPKLKQDTLYQKIKLLDNLGNTLFLATGTGIAELEEALRLSELLANSIRSYSVHRHLSQYYSKKGDTATAVTHASALYALSKDIGDKAYEKEALSLLLKLNQPLYGLRYVALSDSLNKVKQDIDNAYALLKYDKSEAEKEALAAQVSRQRILIFGILLFFVLVFVGLFIFLSIRRKKQRAVLETEQRIAKHVHDDIANSIFLVMNTLDASESILLDELSKIYEQARAISRANNSIDLSQPFPQLLQDLFHRYSSVHLTITPQNMSTVLWHKISTTKKETLFKVLQELLTNTLKHSEATFVVVGFQQKRSHLLVTYSDNGRGSTSQPSGGLLNVENRIRAISGTVTFTSQPHHGFKALIKL